MAASFIQHFNARFAGTVVPNNHHPVAHLQKRGRVIGQGDDSFAACRDDPFQRFKLDKNS